MNIKISINENRSCYPNDINIGFVHEKNIDRIIIEPNSSLPDMKWYLVIDDEVYPFNGMSLNVDERLTNSPGVLKTYIIGSNAEPGKPLTSGNLFFNSDKVIMRVREK